MRERFNVAAAYEALNLSNGATPEEVRSSYKKLALQYHPDKSSDPDASVKFQTIGTAYTGLNEHFEYEKRRAEQGSSDYGHGGAPFGFGGSPFPFFFNGMGGIGGHRGNPFFYEPDSADVDGDDYGQYYDEYSDDEEEYFDDDEFFDPMDFFRSLFEEAMAGRGVPKMPPRQHRHAPSEKPESKEEYEARLRRAREEQQAASERRQREDRLRRERRERELAEEIRQAAERKKKKTKERVASHATAQATAAQKAAEALARRQTKRSEAFAACRKGDAAKIRKAIWEDGVDAAGPEEIEGEDGNKETLLHVAVARGNLELIKWLIDHNAEPEERDSSSQTAFHRALQYGNPTIIAYFLETFPPSDSDSDSILRPPKRDTNLRLAVSSGKPEAVFTILNADIVDMKDLKGAWQWLDSVEFGEAKDDSPSDAGKKKDWSRVRQALSEIEGWTPPASPKQTRQDPPRSSVFESSPPPPVSPPIPAPSLKKKEKRSKKPAAPSSLNLPPPQTNPVLERPISSQPRPSPFSLTPSLSPSAPKAELRVGDGDQNLNRRGRGGYRSGYRGRGRGRGGASSGNNTGEGDTQHGGWGDRGRGRGGWRGRGTGHGDGSSRGNGRGGRGRRRGALSTRFTGLKEA